MRDFIEEITNIPFNDRGLRRAMEIKGLDVMLMQIFSNFSDI